MYVSNKDRKEKLKSSLSLNRPEYLTDVHTHHNHWTVTQLTLTGAKKKIMNVWVKEELKIEPVHLLPQLVTLLFSHLSWWIRRLSIAKPPTCWIFTSWARSSRVGLSGADKQLVPAHHPLPHVHFVQPDVGLPYQGLLHELTSIGYQEKLESHGREREKASYSPTSTQKGHYAVITRVYMLNISVISQ